MEKLVVLILLVLGVCLVCYAVIAWISGAVRAGHNFGTPIYHVRKDSPLLFFVFWAAYLGLGGWMVGYALAVMTGHAEFIGG